MGTGNDDFSNQMEALVFKIRTGCTQLVKLLGYGLLCGTLVGAVASIFARGIDAGTAFRESHPWVIFLMPIGAAVIVFFYQKFDRSEGTDTVLLAVTRSESVPGTMAPLIFCSTITSHFLGASVGREGAALQIGGCIGDMMGKRLHFHESARRIMIMAGMSAAFSALFGTPLAATVIAMEISHVGLLQYDALVPCVIAALPAYYISGMLGVEKHPWGLSSVTPFTLPLSISTFVLAFLCALVSVLFVVALGRIPALARKIPAQPIVRAVIVAFVLLGLTLLSGGQFYNGAGGHVIIGLPGETLLVRDGKVYVDGSDEPLDDSFCPEAPEGDFGPYEIPEGCFFMMGDNRNHSLDARFWEHTYVREEDILGKAGFRYWPLTRMGRVS